MYNKLFRLSIRYSCASLIGIKIKMQVIYHLSDFFHILKSSCDLENEVKVTEI